MPNFLMNVRRADGRHSQEGFRAANAEEAYDAAIKSIRGMICDDLISTGRINLDDRVEIGREEAAPFLTVHFHEAMDGGGRPH